MVSYVEILIYFFWILLNQTALKQAHYQSTIVVDNNNNVQGKDLLRNDILLIANSVSVGLPPWAQDHKSFKVEKIY